MSERQFHKDLRMFLMQLSIYSYEGRDSFAKGLCADALASIPQWIPVEERLPGERCRVLVSWGLSGHITMALFRPDKKRKRFLYEVDGFNNLKGSQAFITHWMPIPEPPEVK